MKTVDMYPKRKPDYPLLVMIALAAALIISCFTGCYTSKKAEQQVNKANDHYPGVVAKLARDKYPCTDLLRPDTAILYRDTLVYIDCPDSIPATFEVIRRDTINNVVTKTVRVPVNLPVRDRIITKWYEDSAKIKLAQIALNGLQKDTARMQARITTLQAQSKRRGMENWIWRAIAITLIVWQGIKLWNRMTTIKMKAI